MAIGREDLGVALEAFRKREGFQAMQKKMRDIGGTVSLEALAENKIEELFRAVGGKAEGQSTKPEVAAGADGKSFAEYATDFWKREAKPPN